MIKSMTGYGRSGFSIGEESFTVEVKSLNARYTEINVRTPERFFLHETKIREEIKKRFSRGTFTVHIHFTPAEGSPLKLNIELAKAYIEAAEELKKELGIKGEVDVDFLLKHKDIMFSGKALPDVEADWAELKKSLYAAFGQLDEWRLKEGVALKADILERLRSLEGFAASIESRMPGLIEDYRKRLQDEMSRLLQGVIDESRVLMEAALFAERTDISEELVRLKSHIDMFRQYLEYEEPVGKRLDFLCQEILREANTIASKSNDIQVTRTVVEIKGLLEKIREQSQNVE